MDWGDKSNWNCNNNVHPSRHGTYDGISMHPYETVFVKASWHVGHPFIDKYAEWAIAQVGACDGGVRALGEALGWNFRVFFPGSSVSLAGS